MRYTRQIQVDKIGIEGQKKLAQTPVLLVGCGGLGCQVGAQLAGAGIGKITLIDHDVVALSNLHRQILFRESDVGDSKSQIAARELRAINSEIKIIDHAIRLTSSSILDVIDNAEIVIDAADNFVTSYILSAYCRAHRIPLVSASVNTTFGWVGVFCSKDSEPLPGVDAVFKKLGKQLINCDTVGVTGTSVAVIGGLQAQEVIKVALGDEGQLSAKLLYLDVWNFQQHIIDFSESQSPINAFSFVTHSDVSGDDVVIDVRQPQEVAESPHQFETILTIPLDALADQAKSLPSNKRLVCACASGQRALLAASSLQDLGFELLAVLQAD